MRRIVLLLAALLPGSAVAELDVATTRLAADVGGAIADADPQRLLSLASIERSPALVHVHLLSLLYECRLGYTCTTRAAPVDATWEREQRDEFAREGAELPENIEAMLVVERQRAGSPADPLLTRWPLARVDGKLRIVAARYTDRTIARYRSMSAESIADERLFDRGVYIHETRARDPEWKRKAQRLPAHGGEPGAAFLARTRALAVAVPAGDVDAVVAATGDWGERLFRRVDPLGEPVPEAIRRLRLRAVGARLVVDAKVMGGWILGPRAILLVEGRNGIGATVRGAQVMRLKDGRPWEAMDEAMVEIPPPGRGG